ncbi:MAG: M48 family metalloprotease [Candidatus Riflebacteria bacterium]|nr:M48 family metalloprotease [Candidatus Riflebacteria bacterium]
MISMFLHLLALAYGTVTFAGALNLMPVTFMVVWGYLTLLILLRWLPDYIDSEVKTGKVPSFLKTQEIFQWSIVLWVLLLQAATDPVGLSLPAISHYLPQTLPMVVSLALYIALARPAYFEFYRLFKPVLDLKQTSADFFRARMTVPILFFPPIMMWMLIEDLSGGGIKPLNDVKLMAAAPLFFVALYLLAPKLFNWAWRAEESNDDKLEDMLKRLSEKAESKVAGVKIWNTFNEPVPNAAVAGLLPRYRFIYITRYLLSIFSPQQVEGVVAHELGHLRLGHVTSYMFYSLNLILASIVIKLSILLYFPQYYPDSTVYTAVELVLFMTVFSMSFTALARHCEFQADAFASEMTSKEVFASTLETLNSIILPPPSIIPNWLLTHPQIQDRIERVQKGIGQRVTGLRQNAANLRRIMMLSGFVLLLLTIVPAKAVHKISALSEAVQAGNSVLVDELHSSLPEWLKSHPLVLQEAGKSAVNQHKWVVAAAIAVEAEWSIRLIDTSQEFHHSSSPEVTFDFEIVKFVLKSLDLW